MKIRKVEATVKHKKTKVAAYCRVSTKRLEQEDSLEVQQSTYTRYIQSNPAWDFAGLYADARSGLSAGKRRGFLHMIEDARAGKIDLILCKSISRFSRNIVECQRYMELLRSRNVNVVFEKDHLRTDMPASSLVLSLMCAIAQDESRSISENIQTANRHRVEAGKYTPRKNQMLGYTVHKGKFVPDQDAWIIRHIFARYAEGAGVMEICRELNVWGARRQRVHKPFTHQIIRHILQNESYVGDKRLQKQPPWNYLTKKPDRTISFATNYLTDDHTPIVSREIWNAVQERLAGEEAARQAGIRRQGNSHELYGRIICGCCGEPYIRRTFTSRTLMPDGSRTCKVWCCRGRVRGQNCRNPNIREEDLLGLATGNVRVLIGHMGEVVKIA